MPNITERLNVPDVTEVARDAIAAILRDELDNQLTLAINDGDPADEWTIDVYTERSNSWDQWVEIRAGNQAPFLNIMLGDLKYDRQRSTVKPEALEVDYKIDVYTFGLTQDVSGGGHIPGDRTAAFQGARWQAIVRAILLSGQYTYLGSPRGASQWCFGRWIADSQPFVPQIENRSAIHGVATRISLETRLRQPTPQGSGEPIEELSVQIKRAGDGKILVDADIVQP